MQLTALQARAIYNIAASDERGGDVEVTLHDNVNIDAVVVQAKSATWLVSRRGLTKRI